MLSLNHSLSLKTELMTVLNKEDWQSMKLKKYESPFFVFVYKAYNST